VPIGKEDIEYIASVAERSEDVYQTIMESLEILMRDLDSFQMYPHSSDDEYSLVGCVHEFGATLGLSTNSRIMSRIFTPALL
jgi:hypothetical protein